MTNENTRIGEAMEEWRTVVIDGEVWDNYEVSNLGRVRSLNFKRTGEMKILQPCIVNGGYLQVGLTKDGKRKRYLVHRLVAFAFIENDDIKNKTDVNHLNEIKTDNRVENLEWTTHLDNVHYGTRTERMRASKLKAKVRFLTYSSFKFRCSHTLCSSAIMHII